MLKMISWGQYFLFAGTLAAGWYAYVFLRFAGKRSEKEADTYSIGDRSDLFVGEEESSPTPSYTSQASAPLYIDVDEQPEWQSIVHTLSQECKFVIGEGARDGVSDEVLAAKLRVALSNYQELKDTAYGMMVAEFIVREAAAVGYEWSIEEVGDFWK